MLGSRKTISLESIENLEVVNRLPILFRTLENKKLTGEDLDRLIELIKSNEYGVKVGRTDESGL